MARTSPQIPINRPHAPVNDIHRDGLHAAGRPRRASRRTCRTRSTAVSPRPADRPTAATSTCRGRSRARWCARRRSSFDDHFSQADAVLRQPDARSSRRTSSRPSPSSSASATSRRSRSACWPCSRRSTPTLCAQVAAGLGLPAPHGEPVEHRPPSPALSQVAAEPAPIAGRMVGVVAGDGRGPGRGRQAAQGARGRGRALLVIAPHGGDAGHGRGRAGRRADLPDGPLDRVRRRRRRRRRAARTTTSRPSCCSRRRTASSRRSPPGATARRCSRQPASTPRPRRAPRQERDGAGRRPRQRGRAGTRCGRGRTS